MSVSLVEPLPDGTIIPRHVALVPDGNRRWAKERRLPIIQGYQTGVDAVRRIISTAWTLGIHTFTLWGLSTENWQRPRREVNYLSHLFQKLIREFRDEFHRDQVRFIHLGRKDRLPKKLLDLIAELEEETHTHTRHILNIGLDYGGRDEIVRAVRKLVSSTAKPEAITEETLAAALDTGDQPHPYPDFLIRTSGEQRTSGFLTWQIAHSEFFWAPQNLPDFTPAHLRAALLDFSQRQRRFGR